MGTRGVVIGCMFLLVFCPAGFAELTPGPQDVFVRMVDCGAALCCVVKMPGPKYMIYDAGNYPGGGAQTFAKIEEIIPAGSTVELMVLSHSDSDHLGAVDEICDAYTVKRVLHSGYQRASATWQEADRAIRLEKETEKCIDINLHSCEYPMGATYRFGDVFVTMVCGFCTPPESWGLTDEAKIRNAGSIGIRLVYKGSSILFAGDAVGRPEDDPPDTCIATEKFMVDNAAVIPIDSDVLIAPHHGGDNASSVPFIQAVSPKYVIFGTGHKYGHPRAKAAQRYLDNGVLVSNMFRTDRGDDERSDGEWEEGCVPGNSDGAGDDDVDILLKGTGSVAVEYRN